MLRYALSLTLAATALAACGRSDDATADSVADSAAAVGPSVDSMSKMDDSAYLNAQHRLDSLKAAGVTPSQGIDSTAARAKDALTNDTTRDTMYYRGGRKP